MQRWRHRRILHQIARPAAAHVAVCAHLIAGCPVASRPPCLVLIASMMRPMLVHRGDHVRRWRTRQMGSEAHGRDDVPLRSTTASQ